MTKTYTVENGQKPTEEQFVGAEAANDEPIVFDDDCPDFSDAMMKTFRSAVVQRNRK